MKIYTDGSSRGNPGPGGLGVIVIDDNDKIIEMYHYEEPSTTNNRMELKAIAYAFYKYGKKSGEDIPDIYSDSAYCINTLCSWMFEWAKNGWKNSRNKTPENIDIIRPMYEYWQAGFRMKLHKVKGHSGDKYNEMADSLATSFAK